MRDLRILLATIACLIAGGFLLFKHFSEKYPPDDVITVTGPVTRAEIVVTTTKNGSYDKLAVQFGNATNVYTYVNWFPQYSAVKSQLQVGTVFTALVDPGERSWIWQLQKDGQTVVSIDEIAAAVKKNNRFDGILGGILLAAGLISIVRNGLAIKRAGAQSTPPS